MTDGPPISGVVICFNERENIARCLESLAFCDEIVVVDSGSTDGTREIAARYTDRIIEQPFLGYVKQKNFALEQARNDWVISLDADEALSPELVAEIRAELAGVDAPVGLQLDRVTWFLGVWHERGDWHPDWQLRVFPRSRARWIGREPHDRISLDAPVRRLRGRLCHWNYRDLSDHIQTIDRFSGHQAQAMYEEGLRCGLFDLLIRPLARFFKGYLLRQGFRMGVPGLIVSISSAYYVFMKYARLWELEHSG